MSKSVNPISGYAVASLTYEELEAKCLMLEAENDMLKQAFKDNDKKWQSDYDLLLAKYELTNERILEND